MNCRRNTADMINETKRNKKEKRERKERQTKKKGRFSLEKTKEDT